MATPSAAALSLFTNVETARASRHSRYPKLWSDIEIWRDSDSNLAMPSNSNINNLLIFPPWRTQQQLGNVVETSIITHEMPAQFLKQLHAQQMQSAASQTLYNSNYIAFNYSRIHQVLTIGLITINTIEQSAKYDLLDTKGIQQTKKKNANFLTNKFLHLQHVDHSAVLRIIL